MEIRAERFKKAGSTHSDAPAIETLMICTYCREKYLWDNRSKDPETFITFMKEFLTKTCLSMALFLIRSNA